MRYAVNKKDSSKNRFLVVVVFIAIAFVAWWLLLDRKTNAPVSDLSTSNQSVSQNDQSELPEPSWKPAENSLQTVVEDYVSSTKGYYSVMVLQPETGTVLGQFKSDTDHFAASLYKLWVVYEGYRKVDDGSFRPDENYLSGWTRGKCLDEAIRSSHSPCAEKLWAEIGTEYLTEKAREYGAVDTNLVALRTNAADVAQILKRIALGEGLSAESKAKYLDSMKTQEALYRRGLPSGFSENATVYNKVGWNEQVEWHDAAIIDFGGGKQLIVVALTENTGSANVAGLAKVIEGKLPN
ncbi:MAG: class A beta-lactamase-related serine hydrolase [bacterium]|nr:class A beta-lactamase-related serine hydrolase [bacterium]